MVFKTRLALIAFFLLLSYGLWRLTEGFAVQQYVAAVPALLAVQIFLNDFLMLYLSYEVEVGRRWFSLLIAPGTILHELSHLVSALVTGCYITDVSLFKFNPRSGLLGYVGFTQPKDKWLVVRNFLVGFAPFIGCGIVLLAASYLIGGGLSGFDLVRVDSYASVYASFLEMLSDYLEKIFTYVLPHPLLWAVVYVQFCVALGSAASTQDIKIFFTSLLRHPISTLFLVLLLYCGLQLSESETEILDVSIQSIFLTLLSAVLFILLYSIMVLSCSLPVVYLGDKFLEIAFSERVITFGVSAAVYPLMSYLVELSVEQSVAASVFTFLGFLFAFKNKKLFYRN